MRPVAPFRLEQLIAEGDAEVMHRIRREDRRVLDRGLQVVFALVDQGDRHRQDQPEAAIIEPIRIPVAHAAADFDAGVLAAPELHRGAEHTRHLPEAQIRVLDVRAREATEHSDVRREEPADADVEPAEAHGAFLNSGVVLDADAQVEQQRKAASVLGGCERGQSGEREREREHTNGGCDHRKSFQWSVAGNCWGSVARPRTGAYPERGRTAGPSVAARAGRSRASVTAGRYCPALSAGLAAAAINRSASVCEHDSLNIIHSVSDEARRSSAANRCSSSRTYAIFCLRFMAHFPSGLALSNSTTSAGVKTGARTIFCARRMIRISLVMSSKRLRSLRRSRSSFTSPRVSRVISRCRASMGLGVSRGPTWYRIPRRWDTDEFALMIRKPFCGAHHAPACSSIAQD